MKKLIIIIFLLFLTGCGEKEEVKVYTNKANLNEQVISEQVVNNVRFYDISVIYDRGISTFKATLKSDVDTDISNIEVAFKNYNGTLITKLEGYINKNVKDETDLVITSDIDLTNAYSIEFIF